MSFTHPHLVIVGAGIVGSSLAYHLARQNARVTLLDKAPGLAGNVTEQSFAWITAGYDIPEAYFNLRQQAVADWHRLENELKGRLSVNWSGALTWHTRLEETEQIASRLINAGIMARLIDRQEIYLLEPNLKTAPAHALFLEQEGTIDPALTAALLIEAAREAGADVQPGNEVLSLTTNGTRVTGVITSTGIISADIVVLAAGTGTAALCRSLGLILPIDISPAILMKFYTSHQFVNHIVSNPLMEIRAASTALTLAAEDYIDESIENNPQAIAQRTLEKIKIHWQVTGQIKLAGVITGQRPIPQDGLPIIGQTEDINGLYLAVMHTGVTLAALAGRLAAAELLNGQDDTTLVPYRPGRFSES